MGFHNSLLGWVGFKQAYNLGAIASPYGIFNIFFDLRAHLDVLKNQFSIDNLSEQQREYPNKNSIPFDGSIDSYDLDQISANSFLNLWEILTGRQTDKLYTSTMVNILCQFELKNTDLAWRLLEEFWDVIKPNSQGIHYLETDNSIVKRIKLFLFSMNIEKVYRQFIFKIRNTDEMFPHREYNYLRRALSISFEYDPVLKESKIPIRKIPMAMVYHLQLLAGSDIVSKFEFEKNYAVIDIQTKSHSSLEANSRTKVNSFMLEILYEFYKRLTLYSWQKKNIPPCERQELIKHIHNKLEMSGLKECQTSVIFIFSQAVTYFRLGKPLSSLACFDKIDKSEKENIWEYWYYLGLALSLIRNQCSAHGSGQITQLINFSMQSAFNLLMPKLVRSRQEESAFEMIENYLGNNGRDRYHQSSSSITESNNWYILVTNILKKYHLEGETPSEAFQFKTSQHQEGGICILSALGLSHKQVERQLLEHKYILSIRSKVAGEIVYLLLINELPEILKNKSAIKMIQEYQQTHEISNNILNWAKKKSTFEAFIRSYVATPGSNLALPITPQIEMCTIAAIAEINRFKLSIWKRSSNNKLNLAYEMKVDTAIEEIHLLHCQVNDTQQLLRQDRFVRLKVSSRKSLTNSALEISYNNLLYQTSNLTDRSEHSTNQQRLSTNDSRRLLKY